MARSLKSVLLEARQIASRGHYRAEWYLQELIDDAVSAIGGPGPESSREEMDPPTNGTLDCMAARVAPAGAEIIAAFDAVNSSCIAVYSESRWPGRSGLGEAPMQVKLFNVSKNRKRHVAVAPTVVRELVDFYGLMDPGFESACEPMYDVHVAPGLVAHFGGIGAPNKGELPSCGYDYFAPPVFERTDSEA